MPDDTPVDPDRVGAVGCGELSDDAVAELALADADADADSEVL